MTDARLEQIEAEHVASGKTPRSVWEAETVGELLREVFQLRATLAERENRDLLGRPLDAPALRLGEPLR